MIYLNLFLISVIWVVILDLSGFIPSFKTILARFLNMPAKFSENIKIKPFECSLCMTWWSGLIYLIFIHEISFLNISAALLISFFTTTTKDFILLVQDLINWVFIQISKLLGL